MSMEEKQNFQTFQDFSGSILKPTKEKEISEIIKECYKKNIPLEILGLGTKKSIGRNFQFEKTLDLSNYSGIIDYKPEELYIKVKSGTPIKDIRNEIEKNNQHLAFEPIDFGYLFSGKNDEGSIGGVMSCNFAGSRRFKAGSIRDHILGFKGINGRGEVIKSGGTVVKNVTGYDLSKILSGSFGTLAVLSEITIKVLPKPESNKTLFINNPHLKKGLDYLNISLSSSSDPSGAVFYPENFRSFFTFNDLTFSGPITAIRIEGSTSSIDHRIKKLTNELKVTSDEIVVLSKDQSDIFWEDTRNLKVFSKLKENLIRIVIPPSEAFETLNKLKDFDAKYFVDWGGSLIWLQLDSINTKMLKDIKTIVKTASGYLTIIKIEENLKASIDVFTVDPVKHDISEKIKRSFDPKRILNPGKMYIGI